jgi:hypothetical protein
MLLGSDRHRDGSRAARGQDTGNDGDDELTATTAHQGSFNSIWLD